VALRILTFECGGPRFSDGGDFCCYGHDDLVALFYGGLNCVRVDALHRDGVSICHARDQIILAIEFGIVLNVSRLSLAISSLRIDLDAFLVGFDL
jgi:hypothetical protein